MILEKTTIFLHYLSSDGINCKIDCKRFCRDWQEFHPPHLHLEETESKSHNTNVSCIDDSLKIILEFEYAYRWTVDLIFS